MPFFKALLPGTAGTFVLSLILGSQHTKAGWLNVERLTVESFSFHWSWPLFIILTGLAWLIFWLLE
jgi:hypothetical protein